MRRFMVKIWPLVIDALLMEIKSFLEQAPKNPVYVSKFWREILVDRAWVRIKMMKNPSDG